jgi:type I restriction enzyme M protein
MDQPTHNKIVSFLWGIANDVLRDLFKRVNRCSRL